MPVFTGTQLGDTLVGTFGADTLFGLGGDDVVLAGAGDDRLFGGEGNDILDPGAGADLVDGGPGNDTIGFASLQGGGAFALLEPLPDEQRATLAQAGANVGVPFSLVANIENLIGSAQSDILGGGPGPNTLFGEAGDDVLGGAGGADFLEGGPGRDAFVFFNPAEGGDVIGDFEPGRDKVILDRAGFWPIGLQPVAGPATPEADGDPVTLATDGTLFVGGIVIAHFTGSAPAAGDILLV